MNDGFDDEQDSSQVQSDVPRRLPELSSQQREIYQSLNSIGIEIAAYYLDGIRILQYKDLETGASLLAHIAREIDGGLRDILSSGEAKERIQKQLTKEVLDELGDYDEFKDRKGHIASILDALGILDPRELFSIDDTRTRIAVSWVNIATQFHKFAHRHGAWRSPRSRIEFENLWYEFEGILTYLVGNSLNILNRLDRILEHEEPSKEIRATLHNLLGSEERRAYFFRKLEFPTWLEPLKEDGWFDPDRNPRPQESPDQSGYYYSLRWHALEYVSKISAHPECSINTLVDIVNLITDESREWVDNGQSDLEIVKIIGTLPIDRIVTQHVTFMAAALKSVQKYGLLDQKIGQTILPKLLNGGKLELILPLLTKILEIEFVDGRIQPIMNEHWLEDALKKYGHVIANLCGVEAVQIALKQIRAISVVDAYAFYSIQPVESDLSILSHPDYTELVVSFTSSLFEFVEPDSIKETVQDLLNEPHSIIKRIAVKAINQHYSELKQLFWSWKGNPLDEFELEPEISQLIQTHNTNFDEDEMEQILQWIESSQ